MKIAVHNYIAIKDAEIELAPLAIVAGPNGAGKTSLALATAAVMLGRKVLIDGVLEGEAGMMVQSGASKATVEITGPDGAASISLPSANRKSTGNPPRASTFALGIQHLMQMDPKQRTLVLIDALKARPAKSDLAAALPECGPEDIERIAKSIKAIGWDGAQAEEADRGKLQKGQWHGVTNEAWGSQKALSWVPKEWEAELNSSSLESLKQEQTDAQSLHDAAISQSAISTEDCGRLERSAARVPDLTTKVEEQEVTTHDCQRLVDEAQAKRRALPEPEEPTDPHEKERAALKTIIGDTIAPPYSESITKTEARVAELVREIEAAKAMRANLPEPGEITTIPEGTTGFCPGCQTGIMFTHEHKFVFAPTDKSRKAAESSTKQREKQTAAIKKADENIAAIKDRLEGARATLANYQQGLKDWDDAQAKLAALPPAPDLDKAKLIAHERLKDIAWAKAKLTEAHTEYDGEQRKLGALEAELRTAQADAAKLKAQPADAISESDVNAHKEQVRLAAQRIEMFTKKTEADRLAKSIALNQKIVAALGPKGVRESKLAQAIGQFNERLATLTKAAGWKAVEFDSDLRVSYSGHEYRMLSTGARFRVQCIIQAALAQLDGSQLWVVDGADVLDSGRAVDGVNRGRPGLLALAKHLAMPCLITMTMKDSDAQALGAAIPTYWLNGGVAELVKPERKAA